MSVELSYKYESELVNDLTSALTDGLCPFGVVKLVEEFYYLRGRTDVVALTAEGNVLAFEAKLLDWKYAMHQAYRNTCFAHESYVVLPCNVAQRAIRSYAEFTRRGVGLCTVEAGDLKIVHRASKIEPLQKWLSERARMAVPHSPCRQRERPRE